MTYGIRNAITADMTRLNPQKDQSLIAGNAAEKYTETTAIERLRLIK